MSFDLNSNDQSFKKSFLITCGIFGALFIVLIAVTPLIPRYVYIFNKRLKVQQSLYDIDKYESEYTIKEEDHNHHTGYSLTENKSWKAYESIQGLRIWIKANIKLERINGLTIKNPEQTIKDGIGDRNDIALLLINMIYVISGEKVDLVLIKDDNPKSSFPMYYLYYHNVFYEVFNNKSYREKQIIEHIPFDKLFSKS